VRSCCGKPDAIEPQIAHKESNSVELCIHHARYLEEYQKMMQWWAAYLDEGGWQRSTNLFEGRRILIKVTSPEFYTKIVIIR
jgi:hypothetical protein